MKKLFLALLAALVLTASGRSVLAANPAEEAIGAELKPIITQIQEKMKSGKDSEPDLADNLKAIDGVIAKHKNDDANAVAGIYLLKAQIYGQVLDNDAKATAILNQVKKDFGGTETAKGADEMLAQIKAEAAAKAVSRSLKPGAPFPDFNEKDLSGKPLSVAGYKGKVVLIDFWATWCPPCRAELPNVISVYKKYHAQGFEIIGISLDTDQGKLESFIKSNGMTWAQYFDGQRWDSKLVKKYGVNSIPMTYLLDRDGKIIGKELRGEALAGAVAKALAHK